MFNTDQSKSLALFINRAILVSKEIEQSITATKRTEPNLLANKFFNQNLRRITIKYQASKVSANSVVILCLHYFNLILI